MPSALICYIFTILGGWMAIYEVGGNTWYVFCNVIYISNHMTTICRDEFRHNNYPTLIVKIF